MSKEHVFPKWLSKVGLPIAGEYVMQRGPHTIRSPIIQVKTRRVCVQCNTGWMKRIEDGAIPVFTPLLEATTNRITEIDRWVIARWFTKTILTAQLALSAGQRAGPLHPQDYQTFYAHLQPFQNQFTLIAGYVGRVLPITFQIHSPDEATNRGVRVLFHFHRLILMATFMRMDGQVANVTVPGGFLGASHVIWPTQRDLIPSMTGDPTLPLPWPPPLLLDEAAVNATEQAFGQIREMSDGNGQDSGLSAGPR